MRQPSSPATPRVAQTRVQRYPPFCMWLWHYRRQDLAGDLLAGVIVAIMLVPQRMAYAMLAGLPPSYLCWPSGWMQASTLPTLGTLKTCFSAP